MRFHLRTLLILATFGPPVLAAIWFCRYVLLGAMLLSLPLIAIAIGLGYLIAWTIDAVASETAALKRGDSFLIRRGFAESEYDRQKRAKKSQQA